MSTSPDPHSRDDYEFTFPAGSPDQPPPPKQKPRHTEENDSVLEDIADELTSGIIERVGCGCAWRLVTLPFRFIAWVIGEIFD